MANPMPGNVPAHGRGTNGEPHAGSSTGHALRQGDNYQRNQGMGYEPGSTSPKFTPEFIFRSCKRWWKVATPLALLCAFICAVAMSYQYVPLYRSSAWLRVEEIHIVFGS